MIILLFLFCLLQESERCFIEMALEDLSARESALTEKTQLEGTACTDNHNTCTV